jgi:hypothetical protein
VIHSRHHNQASPIGRKLFGERFTGSGVDIQQPAVVSGEYEPDVRSSIRRPAQKMHRRREDPGEIQHRPRNLGQSDKPTNTPSAHNRCRELP